LFYPKPKVRRRVFTDAHERINLLGTGEVVLSLHRQ
jgi:hypothetical protein